MAACAIGQAIVTEGSISPFSSRGMTLRALSLEMTRRTVLFVAGLAVSQIGMINAGRSPPRGGVALGTLPRKMVGRAAAFVTGLTVCYTAVIKCCIVPATPSYVALGALAREVVGWPATFVTRLAVDRS